MAFLSVTARYAFESNDRAVLPRIARSLAKVAEASGAATQAVGAFTAAWRTMLVETREGVSSFARTSASVDTVVGSFGKLEEASLGTTRSIVRDAQVMADASEAAAEKIDASNASISRSYARVSANAARARTIASRSGFTRGFGDGGNGVAGAAQAAAVGAGGAGARAAGLADAGGFAGIAAAVGLGFGVRGAGDVQNSALQVAVASGQMGPTFADTMRNVQPTVSQAFQMSSLTGGSVSDMMRVQQNMASSGFTNAQLVALARPMAQLTDVLHFGKDKMGFGEAATQAAGLAHDLRLFNTADAKFGFNRLAQLGYQSPHGTAQLITQTRRFAPIFERMLPGNTQQKASSILEYTAWLDRMGSLQFGGSGLNMLATNLTNPRGKVQRAAMVGLGLMDSPTGRNLYRDERTGIYHLPQALEHVAQVWNDAINKPGGRARINDYINDLPRNSSRIFGTLTTPDALTSLQNIRAQSRSMANLDTIQTQLMQTLPHAFARLQTNVENLATALGGPLVQPLADFIGKLATATSAFTEFLRSHPTVSKAATGLVAGVGVAGTAAFFTRGRRLLFGRGHAAHAAAEVAKGGQSLLRGGRIAEAALDFMTLGPLGRFAKSGFGVARGLGGLAMRGTGATAAFAPLIKGAMAAMPWIAGLGTRLANMGAMANLFGGLGGAAISVITKGVLRMGLKFIPVVGNILMLIQALQFLRDHAHDIGYVIGEAVRWIRTEGVKMFVDAIKFMIQGAMDTVKGIGGALMGGGLKGGVWDTLGSLYRGFQAGNDPQNNKVLPGQVQPLGAAAINGSGNVILHNHGTINMNGDPRGFHSALTGSGIPQHTSAALGNNPLAFPGSSMTGIGGNGSK